jgi:hypothetical protein
MHFKEYREYDICNQQRIIVSAAAEIGWHMIFRKWIDENQQVRMRDILLTHALGVERGRSVWLNNSGILIVKIMYMKLTKYGQMKF